MGANLYKDTLHLPKTSFPMRAGLAKLEPKQLEAWKLDDLDGKIQHKHKNSPRFVLHDGPPYANGHLHHGHILNKILKDIVVRDRSMAGFLATYVPGWDCHGLPIEVQVDKNLGSKKKEMSKVAIRKACREYAERFVGIQREEFRRLGIGGQWDSPYRTMDASYEAETTRQLAAFADAGLLYKGLRPVHWCTQHQTALAEAEVEYADHTSPSIYVGFRLKKAPQVLLDAHAELLIWTTTPWTIPANQGIAVHPKLEYGAFAAGSRVIVVALGKSEEVLALLGLSGEAPLATFLGEEMEGWGYSHPLDDRDLPVWLGEHVNLEQGSGCVHSATAHGGEDFEVGRRYGVSVLNLVDHRGCFTQDAGPYADTFVHKANPKIIADLQAAGSLFGPDDAHIVHRYAHCWRCHKPLIQRATEQWWVAMDKEFSGGGTLRERSLASLDTVDWIPGWGKSRIEGMLASRPDWCLSRQRVWGVPIPVFYCKGCDATLVSGDLMRKVADAFAAKNSDIWFEESVDSLCPGICCDACGSKDFRKEEDILDVWFDSGTSHAAVLRHRGLGHPDNPPADLYLEGSDQHRGWFHSSLLCSLASHQSPPYRSVLTHGFVVDGQGKKISKSKGNGVDPFRAIEESGAELLRLWSASVDYREDIRMSQEILARLKEAYRKVRNTLRFLLGNISDFDPNQDILSFDALRPLEQYAIAHAERVYARAQTSYKTYHFHQVMHGLVEFCTVDLSAFFLDVWKDKLYASGANDPCRRSIQTAIWWMLQGLLRAMAPIFVFSAEEAFLALPKRVGAPSSIHLSTYGYRESESYSESDAAEAAFEASYRTPALGSLGDARSALFVEVRKLRRWINNALEDARTQKVLGSSIEAHVKLRVSKSDGDWMSALNLREWEEVLIVSKVEIQTADEGADMEPQVEILRAQGSKCARCWLQHQDPIDVDVHPDVCARCRAALA